MSRTATLPQNGLRVALDQVARLYAETAASERFAICKNYREIQAARETGKIAFLITMEGIEPLGTDLNQLRVFYELGVRAIGLTHARTNAAGHGGVFAASGSAAEGLTPFGREVVRECEALGVIIDLAHINPAGFEEILSITTKPPIVSHTNARRYDDIERNISDEQIRMIGERARSDWRQLYPREPARRRKHARPLRRSYRARRKLDRDRRRRDRL